jgi:hypothetical protein
LRAYRRVREKSRGKNSCLSFVMIFRLTQYKYKTVPILFPLTLRYVLRSDGADSVSVEKSKTRFYFAFGACLRDMILPWVLPFDTSFGLLRDLRTQGR